MCRVLRVVCCIVVVETGKVCCQRVILCAPHTCIAHRVLITIGISPTQINADFVSLLIHPPLLSSFVVSLFFLSNVLS